MIDAGVPPGPTKPFQPITSKPGRPVISARSRWAPVLAAEVLREERCARPLAGSHPGRAAPAARPGIHIRRHQSKRLGRRIWTPALAALGRDDSRVWCAFGMTRAAPRSTTFKMGACAGRGGVAGGALRASSLREVAPGEPRQRRDPGSIAAGISQKARQADMDPGPSLRSAGMTAEYAARSGRPARLWLPRTNWKMVWLTWRACWSARPGRSIFPYRRG